MGSLADKLREKKKQAIHLGVAMRDAATYVAKKKGYPSPRVGWQINDGRYARNVRMINLLAQVRRRASVQSAAVSSISRYGSRLSTAR